MNGIDYYDIEFKSENDCVLKLNYMTNFLDNYFKLVVMDDDDEKYIPNFDFEYDICDCSKVNLRDKNIWDKFLESPKPNIFINTSNLFEQFKNYELLNWKFEDGRQGFAQMFYLFYRDKMWDKKKAKYIFLVSEENAYAMFSSVNYGFSILLNPIYVLKNSNIKGDEKRLIKTFKKHDFPKIK